MLSISDSLNSSSLSEMTYSDLANDIDMRVPTSGSSSEISNSEDQSEQQSLTSDSEVDELTELIESPEVYAQFEGLIEAPCGRRYGIGKRLGSGGFGTVLLTYSFDDRKYYAMKQIQNETREENKNVARELASLKVLRDEIIYTDHIVQCVDFFEEHSKFYLVMEKMNINLSTMRKKFNAPLSVSFIRIIARQILLGLQDIHDAGYVHGDLKLANVMISEYDDEFIVKIIDLGLMASASELLGLQGKQYGTKEYWAPEMFLGLPLSSKLDIWAAGVMLFELYTGRRAITRIVGFPGNAQSGKHFNTMFLNEKSANGSFQWKDQSVPNGAHSWYRHEGFKELHKYGKNAMDVDSRIDSLDYKFEDLLRDMMYPTAVHRLTVRQALAHDFFRDD